MHFFHFLPMTEAEASYTAQYEEWKYEKTASSYSYAIWQIVLIVWC